MDWATTSPSFQAIIVQGKVLLQKAHTPAFWTEATGKADMRCRGMSRPEVKPPSNPKIAPEPVPPGGRAALPEGSLSKPFLKPQGDENRDPPADAPAPVPPAETVQDER